MRLYWPWDLHREVDQRRRGTELLEDEVSREEEVTAARATDIAGQLGKTRDHVDELRRKGEANQFAQLIVDCLDGLLYRKDGSRWHHTPHPHSPDHT